MALRANGYCGPRQLVLCAAEERDADVPLQDLNRWPDVDDNALAAGDLQYWP